MGCGPQLVDKNTKSIVLPIVQLHEQEEIIAEIKQISNDIPNQNQFLPQQTEYISLPPLVRFKRPHSQLNKSKTVEFNDDTNLINRGGDLILPIKVLQFKPSNNTNASESEEYMNYSKNEQIRIKFSQVEQRKPFIEKTYKDVLGMKMKIRYKRRPRTYNIQNQQTLDRSISEEFMNENFEIIRKRFHQNEKMPAKLEVDRIVNEAVEVTIYNRLITILAQNDCSVNFYDYQNQMPLQLEFKKHQMIPKLIHTNDQIFVRQPEQRLFQPEFSFSEDFIDDYNNIKRMTFDRFQPRFNEFKMQHFNETGIYQQIFRRKETIDDDSRQETSQESLDISMDQTTEIESAEINDVYFDENIDFQPNYSEFNLEEVDSQIIDFYDQIQHTDIGIAQLFNADLQEIQVLLRIQKCDLKNVSFEQFERVLKAGECQNTTQRYISQCRKIFGNKVVSEDLNVVKGLMVNQEKAVGICEKQELENEFEQ